jgi:hypothetical protein
MQKGPPATTIRGRRFQFNALLSKQALECRRDVQVPIIGDPDIVVQMARALSDVKIHFIGETVCELPTLGARMEAPKRRNPG